MKNNITIIQWKITIVFLLLSLSSCTNKEWEEYYSTPSYVNGNLFDALSKDPDYKMFVDLIVRTKCDTIIKRGDQYTVFALTNEALAGLNDNMEIEALAAIMRMHIAPSAIYLNRTSNKNLPAVSGKMLKFRTTSNGYTVNKVSITEQDGIKTRNGVIYRIEKPISSLPNLYDVISTNPDLTLFKKFIDDNLIMAPDPVNNIIIGYDTLNRPIYEEPVNYVPYSEFLETAQPDNEQIISTAFFPSNASIRRAFDRMLVARSGKEELIAPRLEYFNQDTLVAGRFFRSDKPFPGDTAVLLDKIYTHVFVRDEIASLSGTQIFTNIAENKLTVSSAQVKIDVQDASNGYYYILDDIDVPELFFRNEFWLTPAIKTPAGAYTANQEITFFNTAYLEGITPRAYCYTKRYAMYNCRTSGGGILFNWPFVSAGKYKVLISYFSHAQSGIFDVAYGTQILAKDFVTASYYNLRNLLNVVKELGTIQVAADGNVEIAFTCSNVLNNPSGQEDSFKIGVDYLMLQPVDD